MRTQSSLIEYTRIRYRSASGVSIELLSRDKWGWGRENIKRKYPEENTNAIIVGCSAERNISFMRSDEHSSINPKSVKINDCFYEKCLAWLLPLTHSSSFAEVFMFNQAKDIALRLLRRIYYFQEAFCLENHNSIKFSLFLSRFFFALKIRSQFDLMRDQVSFQVTRFKQKINFC